MSIGVEQLRIFPLVSSTGLTSNAGAFDESSDEMSNVKA